MLRQLTGRGARTAIAHDGVLLRMYRGRVSVEPAGPWRDGKLRLRPARGRGIDAARLEKARLTLRARAGGERLQLDARRPRRTLKNLFQEAGIPPWRRERLPLLYCDDELVWVPELGVAAAWQAARGARGVVPEWRETS
jgi:tRNA(Ile)-lysidine synthase